MWLRLTCSVAVALVLLFGSVPLELDGRPLLLIFGFGRRASITRGFGLFVVSIDDEDAAFCFGGRTGGGSGKDC